MEEQAHGHRPHATGFRWLDLSLALSALFISLASLWLTIHNARTMERLVAANSYPNIDFVVGNKLDMQDGLGLRNVMHMEFANTGIGPARLRWVEIGYGGRAALNLRGLLALCCTAAPAEAAPKINYWHSGDVRGAMIQAGKQINVFAWAEPPGDPRWARLQGLREQLGIRVCYCSVFDECYLRDSEHREPSAVHSCAVPQLPWRGD